MDARTLGILIAMIGVVAIAVGGLVAVGALNWFGRLPGDIRYQSDNIRVYFPITTMIILSVVLSVAVAIVRRFF
jgi:hypothetical protein